MDPKAFAEQCVALLLGASVTLACVAAPPPTLPPAPPATTTVITTVPSATADGAAGLLWVRVADTLDFTYTEGTLAGSFEYRAHMSLGADRAFSVDETLDLQCPPPLVAKCTALHRVFHRTSQLGAASVRPILETMAKARRTPRGGVVRIPDEGVIVRTLVVASGGYGAPVVASVGATNDFPIEIGTDVRWSVDEATSRTLRDELDALARVLGVDAWQADQTAQWAKSP